MDDDARAAALAAIDASEPTDPPPAPPAACPDYKHLLHQRKVQDQSVYTWVWSERLQAWTYGYITSWMRDQHGWWAHVCVNKGGEGYLTEHESRLAAVPDV